MLWRSGACHFVVSLIECLLIPCFRMLAAHLAHRTNRAYVFEDFVWSRLPFNIPWTIYDFALRPTRVPWSAFVGGFIAGEDVSAKTNVHRSISSEYYEYVCPSNLPDEHRLVLWAKDAPKFDGGIEMVREV